MVLTKLWNVFYLFFGREVNFTKFIKQLIILEKLVVAFIPSKSAHCKSSNDTSGLWCVSGVSTFATLAYVNENMYMVSLMMAVFLLITLSEQVILVKESL